MQILLRTGEGFSGKTSTAGRTHVLLVPVLRIADNMCSTRSNGSYALMVWNPMTCQGKTEHLKALANTLLFRVRTI
uniref:Uncharacterized protein n=1 Tax=Globodera rostochiensis TaxID=31243 RepID=A0A914GP26_GLORO